jgi:MFS family permease
VNASRRTPNRPEVRLIYPVLALAVVAYSLVQSMVFPVLPVIEARLHIDTASGTWIMTSYFLAAAVATPIVGRLGDAYGKDRLLATCLMALLVGSVLAAVAASLPVMLTARVVQGIGGGVVPVAFGIVRDEFPPDRVAGAVGFMSSLLGVVSGLTLVIAGPVMSAFGFSWLFWFTALFSALVLLLAHRAIPASPVRRAGRVGWPGAILLCGWLVAVLVAVSEAPVWGWGSASVVGLLVGGLVLIAVWALVESRSGSPLIDLALMRRPAVWSLNLVALLYGFGLYTVPSLFPGLLQAPRSTGYGLGRSVTVAGLIALPMSAAVFAAGVSISRIARRTGIRRLLAVGIWISVPPMISLAIWHSNVVAFVLPEIVIGAGVGLCFSALGALVVEAVPPDQTGVASGTNANIRTVGGAIGLAVAASVLGAHTSGNAVYPAGRGYTLSFVAVAVATGLAALAVGLVPRTPRASASRMGRALLHPQNVLVAGTAVVDDGVVDGGRLSDRPAPPV